MRGTKVNHLKLNITVQYNATFTFGPGTSIKFDFWPFIVKSLGTSALKEPPQKSQTL